MELHSNIKKVPFLEEQFAFVVCSNWMTDSFGIRSVITYKLKRCHHSFWSSFNSVGCAGFLLSRFVFSNLW